MLFVHFKQKNLNFIFITNQESSLRMFSFVGELGVGGRIVPPLTKHDKNYV